MKTTLSLVHLVPFAFLLGMTTCAPAPQGAGSAFDILSGATKVTRGARGATQEAAAAGARSSVKAVDEAAGALASSSKSKPGAGLQPVQVTDSELGKAMATLNGVAGSLPEIQRQVAAVSREMTSLEKTIRMLKRQVTSSTSGRSGKLVENKVVQDANMKISFYQGQLASLARKKEALMVNQRKLLPPGAHLSDLA